jgi:hypothetical protein
MAVTAAPISMLARLVQPENASLSIIVTVGGMVMPTRLAQSANALESMYVKVLPEKLMLTYLPLLLFLSLEPTLFCVPELPLREVKFN